MESRWEGLLQLIGLVGVMDAQGVQVLAAPDLELGHVSGLLDLDGARVLPAGGQQEVLDLVNLLWLRCSEGKKRERSESGRLNEAKVSRGESAARAGDPERHSGTFENPEPRGRSRARGRRAHHHSNLAEVRMTRRSERRRSRARAEPPQDHAAPRSARDLDCPPFPSLSSCSRPRTSHTHTLSLSHVPSWLSSSSLLLRVLVSLAGLALPPTKAAAAEAPPGFSQVAVDFPC